MKTGGSWYLPRGVALLAVLHPPRPLRSSANQLPRIFPQRLYAFSMTLSRDDLIAFEADIAAEFNAGKIRAPIHLSGGNEDALIRIFSEVRPDDWVCSNWRSHFHCLLKGVPPDRLKADIMAGKSITLCYPQYRIITSAIVGGILPIATGIAQSIKNRGDQQRVWCFLGDMTSMTGMAHECIRFAEGHDLPIRFIVEDNGKSVGSPTLKVWGTAGARCIDDCLYELVWPHSGAGKRVEF